MLIGITKTGSKLKWKIDFGLSALTGREGEFTDQLARISQSEAIFLLTTFANIATSREEEDKELIVAITLQVYKVWTQFRSFCCQCKMKYLLKDWYRFTQEYTEANDILEPLVALVQACVKPFVWGNIL